MRIIVLSDTHCGHILGLTPKKYQTNELKITSEFWTWFKSSLGKYDVAIWNGDLIEGEGKKESSHHITTDINKQIEIAAEVINTVNAKRNFFCYGTAYHTGNIMDYEKVIADYFGGDIKTKQKLKLKGYNFDIMHHMGKTGTPVGGDISLRKGGIWSMIYDTIDGRETADYIIRSHAHEYRFLGNEHMTAIITPSLKLGLPDYDRYPRRLDGYYSVGFLEFEINKVADWNSKLFKYKISGDYIDV